MNNLNASLFVESVVIVSIPDSTDGFIKAIDP
jgi:hypothetical protein